ncbi:marine proteobacterial sortase target protein [Agaribacter flavus]|uniref:Marine proteobacterial sortase target protein n=1 Tax=Agaribacter flavus TaxID=1902781 RepID=A0ABV7FQ02_9ALTE
MNTFSKLAIIAASIAVLSLIKTIYHYPFDTDNNVRPHTNATLMSSGLINNTKLENIASANQQVNVQFPSQANLSYNDSSHAASQYVTNIYQAQEGNFYFQAQHSEQENKASTMPNGALLEPIYYQALKHQTQFDVEVTGPIVRTKVTQVFQNPSAQSVNGVYVFPLPENAAVDALTLKIGDRIIEGKIALKEEAKRLFEQAKSTGKRASLVSQLRPNVFKNEVSHIPAEAEIIVELEYQQLLLPSQQAYELRLPIGLTPRYLPKRLLPDEMSDTALPHHNQDNKTEVNIHLDMGLPLRNIESLHHEIQIDRPSNTRYYIRNNTNSTQSDEVSDSFVLRWQAETQTHTQVSHFAQNTVDGTYGLISLLAPEQAPIELKRDITFILDTSGSMVGEAMTQAKEALKYAIKDLNESDRFNIIEFSSAANALWGTSYLASKANKQQALKYIQRLDADGGTEMLSALELAFELHSYSPVDDTRLTQFIFVTDGSIGNEAELLEKIHQSLGNVRLFTIGIGPAPNTYFMQEAALVGKGTHTVIGSTALVEQEMRKILKKIKQPVITELLAQVMDGNTAGSEKLEIFPQVIPDLYSGDPLHIYYHLSEGEKQARASVLVEGRQANISRLGNLEFIPWSRQLNLNPHNTVLDTKGIAKQWAYEKIRALKRRLHTSIKTGEDFQSLKMHTQKSITALALKHDLVTDYTSLVAIDNQYAINNEEITRESLPQGNKLKMLAKTATSSRQLNLWGAFLSFIGALGIAYIALIIKGEKQLSAEQKV